MLGVDAPVSLELLRQIVLRGRRQHDRRAADVGARAPRARGRAARGSAPAPAPARVHDRRVEPALAAMSAIEPARPRDPRIPVSPQLALRVAIIGGVAMVMFGVIFFRLWYLQVLSGEQYVAQANANRVARPADRRAARGDPRPRGPADRDEPARPTRCRSCPRRCPPAGAPRLRALPPPRAAAGHERRAHPGAGRARTHGGPVRARDDQDRRRAPAC